VNLSNSLSSLTVIVDFNYEKKLMWLLFF
jgi:hypothetical protein